MGKQNKDVNIVQSIDHKKALQKETDDRINRCVKEVQEVMDKHNCTWDVQMIIHTSKNVPVINVVSK